MAEGDALIRAPAQESTRFGEGFLYDCWYLAGTSGELRAGRSEPREILGEPVLLGRDGAGAVFALRDVCPHRAAPLSAGRLVRDPAGAEAVQCPYHGWLFRTGDGVCSLIPSLTEGQELDSERIAVRLYPVRESQGLVWIWIASDPRAAPEPDSEPVTFDGVVGGAPKLVDGMDFYTHVDHAVVGLMDPTHGPYVHPQWWWRKSTTPKLKEKRFEPSELGFVMVRHAPSANQRAYRLVGRPETEISFRLPGLRWEHVRAGGRQTLALTCLTPVTPTKTRITQLIWSDHPLIGLLKPLVAYGARRFLRQDGALVNLQNQGLKYDPPLLWIDDADRQAKWYIALKREWMSSRREGRAFRNPVQATTLRWKS